MRIPFLAWLLQGIPECIALVALSVSLTGGSTNRVKIIKIGLFQALTTYIIRLVPFTPGVHVLILLTSLSFFLILFFKINLKLSVIASAITVSLLLVFEAVFNTALFALKIIRPEDLINNTLLRTFMGYPQVVFIALLALLINKKGWVLDKFFKGINYF